MDGPHVYVRAWALGCFHSFISTQTFRRALTTSVDSWAEINVPFQWRNQFWQSLEEGAGNRCSECGALVISAQLSSDAVSALRKVRVLI